MLNERITENIVRDQLKKLGYFENVNCTVEEQKSTNPKIQKLLNFASKSGNSLGKPDFIISFSDNIEFLIVIECKSDISKHESGTGKKYKDYAVDGVLLYSHHLSQGYNVMAIAVSGMNEKEAKISHFLQLKGAYTEKNLTDKKLLDYPSYQACFQTESKILNDEELRQKSIEYNKSLHKYSVPETERNTIISAILVALQDKIFMGNFGDYPTNDELVKEMLSACSKVLKKNDIKDERQETIILEYTKIFNNQTLISQYIKNREKKKTEANTVLKSLIEDIRNNVLPCIRENNFDILGRFYREFIRYAGGDSKTGLVLTPSHITDFFCELADLNYDDVVYDPCCGTGGFLVSAMKYMLNKAGNDINESTKIKQTRLIGVEKRADMFTHACSNMMMRGDGKSNIYNGDCFSSEIIEKVKAHKPNKGLLNPPYDVGTDGQLEFIEHTLECITKGSKSVAICQMSTAIKQDKKTITIKERLLENHSLEAVLSMPDQLFYPQGVVTCILIFTAHTPHPQNKEVFLGYFKDDGYILRKHKGRLDSGSWQFKKSHMLNLYINKKSEAGLSVMRTVTAKDEWCAEAYMETDYSNLTEKDFIKTVKNYVAFQFISQND